MKLDEIKNTINGLSESEKYNLLSHIKEILHKDTNIADVKKEIIEKRFSHNVKCPSCGSEYLVKNGHFREQQRFLCRDCKRSFGELSNSNIHSSKKKLDLWLKYAECMIEGLALRKIAEKLEISPTTAFFWRHKILVHIQKILSNSTVEGVVETDETFFLESFKGNHAKSVFKMPRPARKHGSKADKRGISNEQICVVCSIDRKDSILSDMVCHGRVETKDLERFFEKRIGKDSVLCTDAHQSYRPLEVKLGIKVRQLPEGKNSDGIYHIQHVNSYHSRLKGWMRRFNGVATKYLPDYLYWFKWLELAKGSSVEKSERLIVESNNHLDKVLWKDFREFTPQFV